MNNIEKIRELIRDLERGCDEMAGGLNLEQMRRMLVVSECITASIQAYLFKFMTGHTVAAVPGVKADLPGASKVDLNNYPKIKHQIDFLADKYLVNPEHVIIGLLGEALAARRDNE